MHVSVTEPQFIWTTNHISCCSLIPFRDGHRWHISNNKLLFLKITIHFDQIIDRYQMNIYKLNKLTKLISWTSVRLEKPPVVQLLKKFPRILCKRKGSLPCSQGLSTGPYPEPDQISPYHPILSLYDPF
jgi:hypothetical protein